MNYSKVAKTSYANNYNKTTTASKLQPAYNVYHLDSNYTQVNFAVNSEELLFTKGLNSTEFSSRIRIVAKQFDIKTNPFYNSSLRTQENAHTCVYKNYIIHGSRFQCLKKYKCG